ncbi:EAL domain-containing protein [Bradyrhizobium manausense]|uniref:putative bifunctional diguanylate cyclase/phosphodiesterase n=1 Tax=Bradyrhizobium TaxID=374 RepID=UPI001BA8D600|nr:MULTISPECIES: EAL domain-containing protein [Bradyrhizobium]MBR0825687.1 EAL domain-containing protein [Bradyrhizobium manausense]UVO31363.1 EAL domain-containing protein [Bradyrhizobium arachidis]
MFSNGSEQRRTPDPLKDAIDVERKCEVDWKRLLHTAIESSTHGLCVFDSHERLVIGNEQHRAMYALTHAQSTPGLSVDSILESRCAHVAMASTGARPADYLAAIKRREAFRAIWELENGSFVELDMHPMPDGGFVERHRDITELRLAEIRAQAATQELIEKQYALDQAVIVAITDVRGTITYANDRFCEISGYSREELLGNNHRILKSGVHSREVFRQMYRCLTLGEVWRGELCNKAKSGELYWVDTVITPQLGPEGKPVAYMAIRIDITARKKAEAQVYHAARHDALTGLPNRAALLDGLSERLEKAPAQQQNLIVYLLDLDGFKCVNDTLGHAAGDALLKQLSRRLKSTIADGDLIARLGGDEFAIVQVSSHDEREQAIRLSVALLEIVARPFSVEAQDVSVGVSIGIAFAPIDGLTASELLYRADLALYRVKSEGRNGFQFFEDEMHKRAQSRNQLVNELRSSLARGQFELHYQPIFEARTLRPRGAEALVRWRHPSQGLLYPDRFIGIAEEAGLMESLGQWVIQKACADAVSWPEEIKVAVNLSPAQFRGATLFDVILCVLVETGLSPHRLELEVTESMLLQDREENLLLFRQLKNIGVSIALDDFGIGYASLGSVVSFPFSKVKIDRSFTRDLLQKPASKAVVASIMTLARGLDVQVTAEGVEASEQLEYLRDQGVDLIQGYLLGKPVPCSELNLASAPHSGLREVTCI